MFEMVIDTLEAIGSSIIYLGSLCFMLFGSMMLILVALLQHCFKLLEMKSILCCEVTEMHLCRSSQFSMYFGIKKVMYVILQSLTWKFYLF